MDPFTLLLGGIGVCFTAFFGFSAWDKDAKKFSPGKGLTALVGAIGTVTALLTQAGQYIPSGTVPGAH